VQVITPLRTLVVLAAAALLAGGCTSSVDGTAAPQSAGRIEFGDSVVDPALELMYIGTPKAWSQQKRSFGKYLGYRVLVGSSP